MNKITIRKATKKDSQKLFDMSVELEKFNAAGSPKPETFFLPNWQKYFKDEIEEGFTDKDSATFVSEVDGEIAGYVFGYYCEKCFIFEIWEMYVDEKFRGLGLSKKLLLEITNFGKKYKAPIRLEAYDWNKNTLELYEHLGFRKDSVVYEIDPDKFKD